jgi:hypothetical protein
VPRLFPAIGSSHYLFKIAAVIWLGRVVSRGVMLAANFLLIPASVPTDTGMSADNFAVGNVAMAA